MAESRKTVYKDLSGRKHKNDYSGQMRFQIDSNNNAEIIEERQRICTPYESVRYWMAMKEFLDSSGRYARVFHLYETMSNDPTDEEIEQIPDFEKRKQVREAVHRRRNVMLQNYRCKNVVSLGYVKERRYNEYLKALVELLSAAEAANVNPHIDKEEYDPFLDRFVLLDETNLGACRRDFYKDCFLDKAIKEIEGKPFTAYVEPVSIRAIESAFAHADKYKEKYETNRKKRKKK